MDLGRLKHIKTTTVTTITIITIITTCYCGKECKGLRGLKAHQRSCHVVDIPNIKELFEMQDEYVSEESDEERNEEEQINSVKERVLKGIKLPKNKDQ